MITFIIIYLIGCLIVLIIDVVFFLGMIAVEAEGDLKHKKKYCKENRELLPKHAYWKFFKHTLINWTKENELISKSIYYTPLMSFGGLFYLAGICVGRSASEKD